eukprot:765306-Hanusia_phi.AAC.1
MDCSAVQGCIKPQIFNLNTPVVRPDHRLTGFVPQRYWEIYYPTPTTNTDTLHQPVCFSTPPPNAATHPTSPSLRPHPIYYTVLQGGRPRVTRISTTPPSEPYHPPALSQHPPVGQQGTVILNNHMTAGQPTSIRPVTRWQLRTGPGLPGCTVQ